MSITRTALFYAAALLMGGGYVASQWAFFSGLNPETVNAPAEYARRIDVLQVKWLALTILIGCVVIALMPQKERDSE